MIQKEQKSKYKGIRVLRMPNNQIDQNFNGVCEYIYKLVDQYLESN